MKISFLRAYLWAYGINMLPLLKVVAYAIKTKSYEECFCIINNYIYWFKEYYESMKINKMESEVRYSMADGMTFMEACEDWDL